jgi:hypothetical protein
MWHESRGGVTEVEAASAEEAERKVMDGEVEEFDKQYNSEVEVIEVATCV